MPLLVEITRAFVAMSIKDLAIAKLTRIIDTLDFTIKSAKSIYTLNLVNIKSIFRLIVSSRVGSSLESGP